MNSKFSYGNPTSPQPNDPRFDTLEVPISNRLNKPLGETRYADQLIAFYRRSGHVIVEVTG